MLCRLHNQSKVFAGYTKAYLALQPILLLIELNTLLTPSDASLRAAQTFLLPNSQKKTLCIHLRLWFVHPSESGSFCCDVAVLDGVEL